MRFLFFFFVAFPLAAQSVPPKATWVNDPIPHWSCPSPLVADRQPLPVIPICHKQSLHPLRFSGYKDFDAKTQEQFSWVWTRIVPANGVVRIDWPKGFVRMPGCDISGDKGPVKLLENPNDHLTVKAKPGSTVTFECTGIVNR